MNFAANNRVVCLGAIFISHFTRYLVTFSCKGQPKGMTLIEVLIALVILVTGILGTVALQVTAKKASFDAMQRSLASSLVQNIVERMRSNDASALDQYAGSDYGEVLNTLPGKRCNMPDSLCTTTQRVANDQYEWELALMGADSKKNTQNRAGLIKVRACISIHYNEVTVLIVWQGKTPSVSAHIESCGENIKSRRQVLLPAFIF